MICFTSDELSLPDFTLAPKRFWNKIGGFFGRLRPALDRHRVREHDAQTPGVRVSFLARPDAAGSRFGMLSSAPRLLAHGDSKFVKA